MNGDCIFCKIVNGDIPSKNEYEDENFIVFEDLNPATQIHLLIVPKKHSEDISTLNDSEWVMVKKIALELAKKKALPGFRLVNNAGEAAEVKHTHVHFLGEVSKDRAV